MARKLFDAEKGAEELLDKYSDKNGVKIGRAINQAIYNEFLPRAVPTLSVEANHILHEHLNGSLSNFTMKQSLSRGITWMKNYPTENGKLFKIILSHYENVPLQSTDEDTRNDTVKRIFEAAEKKLKEVDSSYVNYNTSLVGFGEDICMHWADVWQDMEMYEVLSYIVYSCDIHRPYDWYDCIMYLREMETLAMYRYNLPEIENSKQEK